MARQMVKYSIRLFQETKLQAKSVAKTFKNNITTFGKYKYERNELSSSIILLKSDLVTTGANYYSYGRCK